MAVASAPPACAATRDQSRTGVPPVLSFGGRRRGNGLPVKARRCLARQDRRGACPTLGYVRAERAGEGRARHSLRAVRARRAEDLGPLADRGGLSESRPIVAG